MNAIVTGASGGIGLAIVKKFAENSINVWACSSKENQDFEKKMISYAEQFGVWIKPVYFDLSNEDAVKLKIKGILNEKKGIDILVNNAGISPRNLMIMTKMDDLRRIMEINFISQILIIQLVAKKMMRQKSGNIVNVGSVSGYEYAERGGLSYGCSKAALLFANRVLAKELSDYNIRVNAVSPGFVETSMWLERSEGIVTEAVEKSTMKRMGKPEEIADVIFFLTTERASYMTGTNIPVSGGDRITLNENKISRK